MQREPQVLDFEIYEVRPWKKDVRPCVHMFADARSEPPHVAAVLLVDGSCFFCDEVTISSWVLVWALEPQHGRPAVKGAPTFQIVTNLVFQVNGALSRFVWWLPQRFPSKKKTRKSTTRTQEISNPNPKIPFFVLVKVKIANHEFRPQYLLSRHS